MESLDRDGVGQKRARATDRDTIDLKLSKRLAQGQVDPVASGQRVLAVGERSHPVKCEARRSPPDHDIAALEQDAARPSIPLESAKQEHRRQPEGYRHDGSGEVALVAVLVE